MPSRCQRRRCRPGTRLPCTLRSVMR